MTLTPSSQPEPSPAPDPEATLIRMLREPLSPVEYDIEQVIRSMPNPPSAAVFAALEERLLPAIIGLSIRMRSELYLSDCVKAGCLPVLAGAEAAAQEDERFSRIHEEYPERTAALRPVAPDEPDIVIPSLSHQASFDYGRLLGALVPSRIEIWKRLLPIIEARTKSHFITLAGVDNADEFHVPTTAVELVFRGITYELGRKKDTPDSIIAQMLEGLKELQSEESSSISCIPKRAKGLISDFAGVCPSLFDGALSTHFLSPKFQSLIRNTPSFRRKLEFIGTAMQKHFGISDLAYLPWEKMPLAGPFVRDICKAEYDRLIEQQAQEDSGGFAPAPGEEYDPNAKPPDRAEQFKRMFETDKESEALRFHGFPTLELGNELLEGLRAVNDAQESPAAFTAQLLGEPEPTHDSPHWAKRHHLEMMLDTICLRDAAEIPKSLIPELRRHILAFGKLAEPCQRVLAAIDERELDKLAPSLVAKLNSKEEITTLAELAEVNGALRRLVALERLQSVTLYDVTKFLDPDFGDNEKDLYEVSMADGVANSGHWAALLEQDEQAAMRAISRASIIRSDNMEERTEAERKLLRNELALSFLARTCATLSQEDCSAYTKFIWPHLSNYAQARFLEELAEHAVTDEPLKAVIFSTPDLRMCPAAMKIVKSLRVDLETWSVRQWYQ